MNIQDFRYILNIINKIQSSKKQKIVEFCLKNNLKDHDLYISLFEGKLSDDPVGLEHWTDEDKLEVMFAYDKHLSVPTIAKQMNKPAYEIQKAIDHFYPNRSIRSNINTPSDQELEAIAKDFVDGMSTADLETKYKFGYQTIRSKLSRQLPNFGELDKQRRAVIGRRPITQDEISLAKRLRDSGASFAQIANELGRTNTSGLRRALRVPNRNFDTVEPRLQQIAADYANARALSEISGTHEMSSSNIMYHLESLENFQYITKLRRQNQRRLSRKEPILFYTPHRISPTLPKDAPNNTPTGIPASTSTEPSPEISFSINSDPEKISTGMQPPVDAEPEKVVKKLPPITKRELNKMSKDFAAGITIADFKSKYGRDLRNVQNKLAALPNYVELKKARDRAYERMTPEDIKIAKRMRKQGKKYTEIANRLKKFPYQVKRALQKTMMEHIAHQYASGVTIEALAEKLNVCPLKLLNNLQQLSEWHDYKTEHLFNQKVDELLESAFQQTIKKYKGY